MKANVPIILLVCIVTLFVLVSLIIFLIYIFFKNRNELLVQKESLEAEVSKSQIEIREDFMRHVGKELHDNIGQVLSTVKLQLSMSEHRNQHADSIALIAQSLNDIRNLSKVVDPDSINSLQFVDSCKIEIERLNRLPHIAANLNLNGQSFSLPSQVEIILFRIVQESLNNSIKHSKTEQIDLELNFDNLQLIIKLKDYGVGFDINLIPSSSGSGLRNMKQRAEMIGASYGISSRIGAGTTIEIKYHKHPSYEQQNQNRNSR